MSRFAFPARVVIRAICTVDLLLLVIKIFPAGGMSGSAFPGGRAGRCDNPLTFVDISRPV